VQGDWEFTLGPSSPQRNSCGHQRPDNQNNEPTADELGSPTESLRLSLSAPNMAAQASGPTGTFTMIYDEAFEVQFPDQTFFAFSAFDLPPDGKNVSRCGDTLLGWYRNNKNWGCYIGKKVDGSVPEKVLNVQQNTPSFAFDTPLSAEWHQSVVDRLNGVGLIQKATTHRTWKAKVYDEYINKTPRELNRMAGISRSVGLAEARRQHQKFRPAKPVPSFLQQNWQNSPESLDWVEEGVTDPVINQGDCGSCYTVATIRMLSARHRISERNNHLEPFSINFPLYCAEYNQGCDGGYAFLQSKWSEDVGLIPERCAPYSVDGQCPTVSASCLGSEDRVRASDHRYVGGYYGGGDEEEIKRELVQNGPLVVSFEPKDDFMYYSNGIYKSGRDAIHQEWSRVDHAVLLVGFGEEDGQPFWKVQNSWGPQWGENGYFRISRGDNDSGIESIAVASDVVRDPEVSLEVFLQK